MRMIGLTRSSAILSLFLMMACGGQESRMAYTESSAMTDVYGVGPSNICLPLGRVLLIRREGRFFALRVVRAFSNREKDAFTANFEVSALTGSKWENHIQKVEERPLHGLVHPFAFQTGITRVDFGVFALRFNGPSCVSMYQYGEEERDQGIAFAPTAWTSVSDVRVDAPQLQWYRVDLGRSLDLPLSSLTPARS
jgi:hypothetical protein